MKPAFRKLDPPFERSLGNSEPQIQLYATGAGRDDEGGVRAIFQIWNGTIKHEDRLLINSAKERKRFVTEASAAEPHVPQEALKIALLEMSLQISRRLDEMAQTADADEPADVDVDALWEQARELAIDPKLLIRVGETVAQLGLVGEQQNALLLYLAATARLLPKLVNIITKGPSSGGKSFSLERVLELLPPSAFVDYSSVSPRYLAYCDDDLRHRIVVLYEAAGLEEGTGAYIMRSLLSEGRLSHGTVEKNDAGINEARRVVKEGPTALFTTTTLAGLDKELETRTLNLYITDTPQQSAAIVLGLGKAAAGRAPEPPDLKPFHALQEWLAVAGERRVVIPYAEALAPLVKCQSIRIRRDFRTLLSLIQACAILHQCQREHLEDGTIQAALMDYAMVSKLMQEYFSAAQQDGLTPASREAYKAVKKLCDERSLQPGDSQAGGVSLTPVAQELKLDKSAASRRLANLQRAGYLKNLETRKGQPAAYVVAEELPPALSALPTVEVLQIAWGAER